MKCPECDLSLKASVSHSSRVLSTNEWLRVSVWCAKGCGFASTRWLHTKLLQADDLSKITPSIVKKRWIM